MIKPRPWVVPALFVLAATPWLQSQTVTAFTFEPADADYSQALDRMILLSAGPNLLHIYNPVNGSDVAVPLRDAPVNVSVSPDGLHAAVAHPFSVSYINLQTATLEKTFPAAMGNNGRVILGPDYVYVNNATAGLISINLATSQSTPFTPTSYGMGRYNLAQKSIYSLYSYSLLRYGAASGPVSGVTYGPFISGSQICGVIGYSSDWTRIYDACGGILRASSDPSIDMTFSSSLGLPSSAVGFASSEAANKIAVVLAEPFASDTEVDLYDNDFLNPSGKFLLPDFVVGGNHFKSHGMHLFYNKAGTSLFAVIRADATSGLQYDQALFTIPVQPAAACPVTLGVSASAAAGAGGIYSTAITADSACTYQASANVNWIDFSSGYYGSGSNTLTYQVRQNTTGSQRSGVITVNGATLMVTQSALGASGELNPLGFRVAAADYSKSLDKIIMVSKLPNQLHIYDGSTQNDQIVPLSSIPLSLFVSADGSHAAVGHNGWVSYVNLQTATVEKLFTVGGKIGDVAIGNGYIYAMPGMSDATLSVIEIASGAITKAGANAISGNFQWPQITASGNRLYLNTAKFDITSGIPSLIDAPFSQALCYQYWISKDSQRLYTSCGTVLKSSDDPSVDKTLLGTVSTTNVAWAADSAVHQETAVITGGLPGQQQFAPSTSPTLQFNSDADLSLIKKQTLPAFSVGGSSYPGYGQYVFWSKDESKLYVIEEADPSSKLVADWGVAAINETTNPSNCAFTVSGFSGSMSGAGGTATYNVTAVPSSCSWSTDAGSSGWISIASGTSGTGNGTVTVKVAQNNGFAGVQSANLTIAGQAVVLKQDGPCTYSTDPTYANLYSNGGSGNFAVKTGSGCPWTAVSTQSSTQITSAPSGVGNGTFSFTASPNTGTYAQLVTINIAPNGFSNQFAASVQVAATAPPTALRFVPITPCRAVDTRNPTGAFGAPMLKAYNTRTFALPNSSCGLPTTAKAYALNVTVVPHPSIGYLTVWPAGQSQPTASTLNSDGRVKAVAAIIPAGTAGGVSIYSTDNTDLILDVSGYFVAATDNTALAFYPLTPCRVLDTRMTGPSLPAGGSRTLPVSSSSCGVPANAKAYSLNFTVVPVGGLGYLTSWPTGQAQPPVSTMNANHSVTANAAIVPAGTNGSINMYASDATDVIVDIDGYFAPASNSGLSFYTLAPCRALDTRYSYAGQGVSGSNSFPLNSYLCTLPTNASAYVLNTTVVPVNPLGYLSIWATGQSQPVVSTLNAWDEAVTSNMAIAPSLFGSISIYTSDVSQVILDVSGYFAP